MKLVVGNLFTRVEDATVEEQSWLSDYLVFRERVYNPYARAYQEKETKLFNLVRQEFPAGYTRTVVEQARQNRMPVEVVDVRVPPCKRMETADLEWLRHHPAANVDPIHHQIEAVETVWRRTRGILRLPTGAGKTEVACGIVKSLPCRWLFVVHRADLLKQTAERFERRCPGEKAGMVGDGIFQTERFTVALFQTLYQRRHDPQVIELLNGAQGLIVDECHALAADTFWQVGMATPNAYYRVGLSGTPLQRGDKRSTFVVAALGSIIYRVSAKQLQEIGVLSRPKIVFQTVRQLAQRPTWQGVYSENIANSKPRNQAVVQLISKAAKPCLVFFQQLKHGDNLLKLLTKKGIKAECISGKEPTAQRQAAVERLVRRDIDVLLVNVIFQEGVDIPALQSVVIATGGASAIAALQRVGRGMRATKDKTSFEVWEIADQGCGCDKKTKKTDPANYHPGCQWLDRHTKERLQAYADEEYEVQVVDDTDVFRKSRKVLGRL